MKNGVKKMETTIIDKLYLELSQFTKVQTVSPEQYEEIKKVVCLALANGFITRGVACKCLNLQRWELDQWMIDNEII